MATDQAERNKQAVRAMYEALTGGDPASAFTVMQAVFAPDVVVYQPDSLPYGGVYHGFEGFLGMMATAAGRHFDSGRIGLEKMVADGDNVVVRWRYPFRASADDEFVDVEVNEWLTFRDGKIIEARPFYWDTAQLMKAAAAAKSDG